MRLLAGGLAVASTLMVAGCGTSHVSLKERPKDVDSARDLATTVADRADCGSFEDYQIKSTDYWTFTCQKSDRTYLIRADAATATRGELIKKLKTDRDPYKTGPFFLVAEFHTQGLANSAADLNAFPGDLVVPH